MFFFLLVLPYTLTCNQQRNKAYYYSTRFKMNNQQDFFPSSSTTDDRHQWTAVCAKFIMLLLAYFLISSLSAFKIAGIMIKIFLSDYYHRRRSSLIHQHKTFKSDLLKTIFEGKLLMTFLGGSRNFY